MNQIEIGLQAYQIETWGVIGNTMAPLCFLLGELIANENHNE